MGQKLELDRPEVDKEEGDGYNTYLQYGCAGMQGYRLTMEDRHNCLTSLKFPRGTKTPVEEFSFFAIFDGHGGQTAAHYCSKILKKELVRQEAKRLNRLSNQGKRIFSDHQSIINTFMYCDREFCKIFRDNLDTSGSTCNSVIIVPYSQLDFVVICCNVGDSRCVILDSDRTSVLSIDHKPTIHKEQDRILEAGGYVDRDRVNGSLALSRAFGDSTYKQNEKLPAEKQCVIATPGIQEYSLRIKKGAYQFLVLGCDGIWDVMKNDEVVKFVKDRLIQQEKGTYYKDREVSMKAVYSKIDLDPPIKLEKPTIYDLSRICCDLLDECVIRKQSRDNVSVIIVLINAPNERMLLSGRAEYNINDI